MSDTTNRIPIKHWLGLAALTIAVWVLAFAWAEKSEGAERGDIGFITAGTHLCHTSAITPQTISALAQWASLIERLEAAGGAIFLSEEDNDLGASLGQWCSTLATGYPVGLFKVDGDYALIYWDKSLGFGSYTMIIRLHDFQEGGLRL